MFLTEIGVHTASGAEAKNQTTGGQRRRTARSGECSIDYWSPRDEEKHENHGHRCAVKGTSGQFEAMKVLKFVKWCGAAETEIILNIDQMPWLTWSRRENWPSLCWIILVGSSDINGVVVERSVQTVGRFGQDTFVCL